MFLNALLSLEKIRQFLITIQTLAVNGKNGQCPGDIFPNFISPTSTGPINFWDWAKGNWVYIFGFWGTVSASFDQLISFGVASEVLGAAGVKVLSLSAMKLEQLQDLLEDVSMLAGQTLTSKLLVDQDTKHPQRLGLHEQKGDSGAKQRNFWPRYSAQIRARHSHQDYLLCGQNAQRHDHRKKFPVGEAQSPFPEIITLGK